jgi:hypothetical protein
VAHNKREVKAKKMILDAINDHSIPHVFEKKRTKEMFDALVSLYQSQNINMKMILWSKFGSIVMTRSNTLTSYLMKVTQIRDQLALVGEKVEDGELVNTTINRFLASRESFVKGICAWDNPPNFERLWDHCIQEETRME